MDPNVRTELRGNEEEVVLTKTIDDRLYQENCREERKRNGDGFIRDVKGAAIGRRLFSIPVEEAAALMSQNDPDFVEWWKTNNDNALARLILRFPHWVVAEGGGLL
ncbi:hypothetical protein [Synergistes jonesii]|uniref:hypothetical protein n=1 Tax=Synergistes jonesii TaxID=2754 RepID=UPI00248D8B24|nr:hypothetical protein [Synergistes jonesii]